MGENERRMRDHADKLMRKIWEAAGASDIWTPGTHRPYYRHLPHWEQIPTTAVVNPWGRSFDIPNLWISDNFDVSLAHWLPILPLTIMALGPALRGSFFEGSITGHYGTNYLPTSWDFAAGVLAVTQGGSNAQLKKSLEATLPSLFGLVILAALRSY